MFVFLETDSFANEFTKQSLLKGLTDGEFRKPKDNSTVRRPYRGIQIKNDTYATLSVVTPTGKIALTSSSATVKDSGDKNAKQGKVSEYSDFILQRIDDQRAEKKQIIETFGEPFIYFYGEQPRVVSFSGLLVNTEDFNWRAQFWHNYEEHLRGTKLVQANARVYLSYDTIMIEGYPFAATAQDTSDEPYSIPFQMQMFVTAYYDFSSIGQTRYPGKSDMPDTAVLNKELAEKRGKFVSTTGDVRRKNIEARGPKGILSEMRKGIKGLNNLMTVAGNYVQKAGQALGGRVVRVPVGVAGYLASVGQPVYAAGVFSTGTARGNKALETDLNSRIGAFQKYVGVTGSVKVRAPKAAQYAPTWVSAVDGSFRGFIWENLDEYPERNKPNTLYDLIHQRTYDAYYGYLDSRGRRDLGAVTYEAAFDARILELTDAGGSLQEVAERVSFAKSNFGMVMNAKSFVQDPVGVGKAVVGLTASDETIIESLSKRGIMAAPGQASLHISAEALQSFSQTAQGFVASAEQLGPGLEAEGAALGASYEQAAYQAGDALGVDYENAYGEDDYTGMVGREEGASSSLTEAYGDSDAAPEGSEVDPATFVEVYGSETVTPASPGGVQQTSNAQNAQDNNPEGNIEDVRGIRGVEDEDASIEPVV